MKREEKTIAKNRKAFHEYEIMETFEAGIEMTVSWYLENGDWWRSILDRDKATERRGVAHG